MHNFDYLLVEPKSRYLDEMKLLHETHEDVEFIECFNSIGLQYHFLPVKIKTRPCIGLMKKKETIPAQLPSVDQLADILSSNNESYLNSDELIEDLKESILLDAPTHIEEDIDIIRELTIDPDNSNDLPTSFDAFNTSSDPAKPIQSNTKTKLKRLIESHFRSKGSIIESDKEDVTDENKDLDSRAHQPSTYPSAKANIKRIIKAEQIKEMVERISKLDLNAVCDLEKLGTKECLKKIIDDYDYV